MAHLMNHSIFLDVTFILDNQITDKNLIIFNDMNRIK